MSTIEYLDLVLDLREALENKSWKKHFWAGDGAVEIGITSEGQAPLFEILSENGWLKLHEERIIRVTTEIFLKADA